MIIIINLPSPEGSRYRSEGYHYLSFIDNKLKFKRVA